MQKQTNLMLWGEERIHLMLVFSDDLKLKLSRPYLTGMFLINCHLQ